MRVRLGAPPTPGELDRLFGSAPTSAAKIYDWEGLFLNDYGDGAPPARAATASR